MTLSRGLCVEPVAVCWICRQPLAFWTDGEGNLVEGCVPCHQRIEALSRYPGLFERVFGSEPKLPEPVVEVVFVSCQHSPKTLARAKDIAQREGLMVAARRTKVKYETLYWHAERERWRVMDGRTGRVRAFGRKVVADG